MDLWSPTPEQVTKAAMNALIIIEYSRPWSIKGTLYICKERYIDAAEPMGTANTRWQNKYIPFGVAGTSGAKI